MIGARAIAVALPCAALASSQLPAQAMYPWALPPGFPPPTIAKRQPDHRGEVRPSGVFEVTRNAADVGKVKAPTLRNVAVTAPSMHDGSVATLEDAIDHYAAGGRTIATGDHAGIGRDNPNKSSSVRGFALTKDQRADLIAFLQSLTDEALLRDSRFSNPWVRQPDR